MGVSGQSTRQEPGYSSKSHMVMVAWLLSPRWPPGYPRQASAQLGVPGGSPTVSTPPSETWWGGGTPLPHPEHLQLVPRPVETKLFPEAQRPDGEWREPGSRGWGGDPGGWSRVKAELTNQTWVRILPLLPAFAFMTSQLLVLPIRSSLFRGRLALFLRGGVQKHGMATGPQKSRH